MYQCSLGCSELMVEWNDLGDGFVPSAAMVPAAKSQVPSWYV